MSSVFSRKPDGWHFWLEALAISPRSAGTHSSICHLILCLQASGRSRNHCPLPKQSLSGGKSQLCEHVNSCWMYGHPLVQVWLSLEIPPSPAPLKNHLKKPLTIYYILRFKGIIGFVVWIYICFMFRENLISFPSSRVKKINWNQLLHSEVLQFANLPAKSLWEDFYNRFLKLFQRLSLPGLIFEFSTLNSNFKTR